MRVAFRTSPQPPIIELSEIRREQRNTELRQNELIKEEMEKARYS
jgi:hypothetical protein